MPYAQRIALGGRGADEFEEFFARYARVVAAAVALATGDIAAAEDAVQEAMTSAYVDWAGVSRMGRPDIWVLRVAQRKAIDAWRKRSREGVLEDGSTATSAPDVIQRLWVTWGLQRLAPEDRMLVILRHRDSLSVDEIAAALQKPSSPAHITSSTMVGASAPSCPPFSQCCSGR
jgi:DNA-directed RNA polymerase specialized sigma24 family protein